MGEQNVNIQDAWRNVNIPRVLVTPAIHFR